MADIELPPTETLPPLALLQQQAADCLNQQKYEEAIALLEQCIDQNPAHLPNYWHLGLAAFLTGDELTAQTVWFSVLSQADATEAEDWLTQLLHLLEVEATRCLQTEDRATAQSLYEQMLELRPDNAEPHLGLGLIAYQENEFEQGVEHFTQFIQQDATFARAFHHLGNCYLKLERYEEAIAAFQQGLALGEESVNVHQSLGQCLHETQQHDAARQHLKKALEVEPDSPVAWFYLGCCDYAQKRLPTAAQSFQRAIHHQPDFYTAHINLGRCLRDLAKPKQAIQVLEQAIALRPNAALSYNNLGACYSDLGYYEDAIAALTQAMMLKPNFAEAYSNLGVVHRDQGEIEEAIAYFEQALVYKPDLAETREQIEQITHCLQAGYFPGIRQAKGAWDAVLFKEETGYRLIFLVGDRAAYPFWSVGEFWSAVSPDLKTWTPLGPILEPDPDSYWQSGRILSGTLRHEQGRYYLFYSAAPPGEAMLHESIGLATSEDGIHWRRSPSPLVEPDPAIYRAVPSHVWDKELEHRAWRDPYLVYDPASQQYYMFTSACCHGDNPHYSGCVGLAVSDRIDGPYRVCQPAAYPCLEGTNEGLFYELERPQVFHHDGLYHLFFSLTPRMINPTWLERVGLEGITESTLYWFTSPHLAGP
ncbi:MAG: tetratricopeptide repeat protein, partial [Synechococcales bacterium]|nr:tetratricopeptide repeat protein [Synechococcales bacterium]